MKAGPPTDFGLDFGLDFVPPRGWFASQRIDAPAAARGRIGDAGVGRV